MYLQVSQNRNMFQCWILNTTRGLETIKNTAYSNDVFLRAICKQNGKKTPIDSLVKDSNLLVRFRFVKKQYLRQYVQATAKNIGNLNPSKRREETTFCISYM